MNQQQQNSKPAAQVKANQPDTVKVKVSSRPGNKLGLNQAVASYRNKLTKIVDLYRKKEEAWQYSEVALTLFAISFFVIFAIRPAVSTIASLVGEIKEKEKISLKMGSKINAIISAQDSYALIQENSDLIDSFLPTELNISQGLIQMIGAAGNNGVIVGSTSISEITLIEDSKVTRKKAKKEEGDNLIGIDFSFSGKGQYLDLKNLLGALIQSRRWIDISRYQISLDKNEENDLLGLSISGNFFSWKHETGK